MNSLLEHANVHTLSYVNTRVRQLAVEKDVTTLPCYKKLAGVHTCWTRVGPGGKADWCNWLGAHAIFDDCNEIIQECHANGIMAFAICTNSTVDPAQQYTRSCWRKSILALEKATGSTWC